MKAALQRSFGNEAICDLVLTALWFVSIFPADYWINCLPKSRSQIQSDLLDDLLPAMRKFISGPIATAEGPVSNRFPNTRPVLAHVVQRDRA